MSSDSPTVLMQVQVTFKISLYKKKFGGKTIDRA